MFKYTSRAAVIIVEIVLVRNPITAKKEFMKSAMFLLMAASLTSSVAFAGNYQSNRQVINNQPVDTYSYTVKTSYDEHGSLVDSSSSKCDVLEAVILRQIKKENQIDSEPVAFVAACKNAGKGIVSFAVKATQSKSAYFSNSEEGL